jgi:hypothetical protein
MPVLQTDTVVYTFQDVVEHLLDLHGVDRDGLNQRNARRAILSAYRDLPNKHPWGYYYRQRLFQTAASYSTGTVAFDHTGGANERQLTLTTGTWPTWAEFGRVIIDSVHYEVERRISSSIVTLREDSNPGADVAALTTYEIYRNAYPLPANFHRLGHLWDVSQNRSIPVIEQQAHHDLANFYDTPSTPWQVAIRGTSDYYATMQLLFGPPPNELRTYDLLYEVTPRPLKIDEYKRGTIAISGTGATITGGVAPASCVGSILRVAATADAPSGATGGICGDNPFASQHVIKTRTSDTVLVLEESGSTVTGMGYVISDPIDIEAGAMLNAFLRMCEAEFCRTVGRKDANDRMALAHQAIIEAIEADQRMPRGNGPAAIYDPFRNATVTTE